MSQNEKRGPSTWFIVRLEKGVHASKWWLYYKKYVDALAAFNGECEFDGAKPEQNHRTQDAAKQRLEIELKLAD